MKITQNKLKSLVAEEARRLLGEQSESGQAGFTLGGQWPAHELPVGMRQGAAQQVQPQPQPHQTTTPVGLSGVMLSKADYEVLQWILHDLTIGVGRGNMAPRFRDVMGRLGVSLVDPIQTAPGRLGPEAGRGPFGSST